MLVYNLLKLLFRILASGLSWRHRGKAIYAARASHVVRLHEKYKVFHTNSVSEKLFTSKIFTQCKELCKILINVS